MMSKRVRWLTDDEWTRIRADSAAGPQGCAPGGRPAGDLGHRLYAQVWSALAGLFARVWAYTTVYNRFNRWSRQGPRLQMFEALTGHSGIFDEAAIDATHIKAHRSAAGAKGGDFAQAIGCSRGGRTAKLHGLVDDRGRRACYC